MSDPLVVDLFVEDLAHEVFVRALVDRIAREEQVALRAQARSARGGHPRALEEFGTYQSLIEKGALAHHTPDVIIVVIDGNCSTARKKREEIERAARPSLLGRLVAGCPNPHVERWFLADPDSFHEVVGHRPVVGRGKCERGHYKRLLAEAIRQGNQPATLGGIEFAAELVEAMNLYRAGKGDSSLKAFIDDLRGKLRAVRGGTGRKLS